MSDEYNKPEPAFTASRLSQKGRISLRPLLYIRI